MACLVPNCTDSVKVQIDGPIAVDEGGLAQMPEYSLTTLMKRILARWPPCC